MAVAAFKRFAGLMPSVKPRALPNESAQTAENLDLSYGDFRPTKGLGASVTTVSAAAKSIFRTPTGVWLNSTNDVNYVLGQLQDTTEERVCLTGRSAYPEMWVDGTYRRLGVPAPTDAPTVTVEEVEEFSNDELSAARIKIPEQVKEMYLDSLQSVLIGPALAGPPTTTTVGWLAHLATAGMPTKSELQYAFCVPMELVAGAYAVKDPEAHNFLLFPEFGGRRITYSGNQYWAVPMYVRAQGQSINTVTLTAALKTIVDPSTGSGQLIPDADVGAIVAYMVNVYDQEREPLNTLIDAITVELENLGQIYTAAVTKEALRDATVSYFASPEVEAQIEALVGTSTGASALTNNPDAGAYTQRVAQHCYYIAAKKPNGDEDFVSDTRYFHNASDADTATNIRADLNANISTDSRGVKVVDTTALAKIMRDEMEAIISQRAEVDRWGTATVDAAVAECMQILKNVFNDENWSKSVTSPLKKGIDTALITSALYAKAGVEYACTAVTDWYGDMRDQIDGYIRNKLFDADILVRLPKPVDRLRESRSYFYTYVSDLGEESAASPACAVFDCDQNDIVTVMAPSPPPAGRYIRRIRLYRSSTSNTSTAFQFVIENPADVSDAEWAATPGHRTLIDQIRQEDLKETCPTIDWQEPPSNGTGLIGMPNGIMLMFDGARIYPCEAFHPYAFPPEYQLTMEFDFVAASVFGSTAVILTEGTPYYCSGSDPASLSLQKIESNQSCISKRSVDGGEGGVFFASPDGICLATPSGISVVTAGLYSREDWQDLDPENSIGKYHDGAYYLFLAAANKCLRFDLRSKQLSSVPIATTGAYVDLSSDTLYVVSGTSLLPMYSGARATGRWRSKKMYSPSGWRFSCAKVESDFEAPVTVRFYGDSGVLIHTKSATTKEAFRLPDKTPADFEVEIESTSNVTMFAMATSMKELSGV